MSTPDYEVHLNRRAYDSLWSDGMSDGFPSNDDDEDIDKILSEELGAMRRKRSKRRPRR